ncbi:uncharacterized protein J3R85_007185 [Psidium guajava]|nr:uncharacterized protein J3R85_007185 [Psidium guajava]
MPYNLDCPARPLLRSTVFDFQVCNSAIMTPDMICGNDVKGRYVDHKDNGGLDALDEAPATPPVVIAEGGVEVGPKVAVDGGGSVDGRGR